MRSQSNLETYFAKSYLQFNLTGKEKNRMSAAKNLFFENQGYKRKLYIGVLRLLL